MVTTLANIIDLYASIKMEHNMYFIRPGIMLA